MRKIAILKGLAVMGGVGMLGGCCHCIKPAGIDSRPLPPAISLEQQVQALNARASAMPRFKAVSESGGVEVIYTQDGKLHHDSGEGTLFLAQNYAEHSANVYLVAKALGQQVFSLGKNEKVQWTIQYYGGKPRANVSPVKESGDLLEFGSGSGPEEGWRILRADLIPELLAITEIVPSPEETLVMRVDDLRGVNDLLVERMRGDGTAVAEREIIIDRRSGEVREVDLFGGNGALLVHAVLDGYAPVTWKDAKPPQEGTVPTMPRQIVIDQPGTHFRLGLTLASVVVPASLPVAVFDTPDWSEEGIVPVEGE